MKKFKVRATFIHSLTLNKTIKANDEKEALINVIKKSKTSEWIVHSVLKTITK